MAKLATTPVNPNNSFVNGPSPSIADITSVASATTSWNLQDKNGNTVFTLYSNTGKPRSKADFEMASNYLIETKGSLPEGFGVMQPGMLANLRSKFEQGIANPLRSVAGAIERSQPMSGGSPGNPNPLATLLHLAKQAAPPMLRGAAEPEGFGAIAGMAASAPLTMGMSLPAGAAFTGISGALGSGAIGGLLTGEVKPERMLIEGLLASASHGATGIVKMALGKGVSQQAQKQVASELAEYIYAKHKYISNDPQALEVIMSTPKGITDITQMGIKGILGDFDKHNGIIGTTIDNIVKADLTRNKRRIIQRRVTELGKQGTAMLENVTDLDAMQAAKDSMKTAVQDIFNTIDSSFGTMPGGDALKIKVAEAVMVFNNKLTDLFPATHLFNVLKESGATGGFKVQPFQELLRNTYKSNPGSLMHNAGKIAARGGDLTDTAGMDRSVYITDYIFNTLRLPSWLRSIVRGPKLGTQYSGTVKGTYPGSTATADIATRQGIKSFTDSDKE